MKQIALFMLVLCIIALAFSSCGEDTRYYRLRDTKSGAVVFREMNSNYRLGDTVQDSPNFPLYIVTDTSLTKTAQ